MKFYLIIILSTVVIVAADGQFLRKDEFGNVEVIGDRGEILEYRFLDQQGNFRQGDRLAKRIYTYDSLGFLVTEKYYKSNGRPYQYSDGMAMIRYIWNSNRDQMVIENFDSTGHKTFDKEIGASIICYRYDSAKTVKEVTYLDVDSIRINSKENCSRIEFINFPFKVEKYYDQNERLVRVLNDTIKFLRGLQLLESSVPRWIRSAKQRNLVDGVVHKTFAYSFILGDQDFEGDVQLSVLINSGDVKNVHVLRSNNMSKDIQERVVKAFTKAHFISLTMGKSKPFEGQINVIFEKSNKSR